MLSEQSPVRGTWWCRAARLPLALLAAILIVAAGCDNEKKVTPPPDPGPYLDQSSAVNVLENLKTAFERKEPLEYGKLFAADFVFFFNPVDPYGLHPTPQLWGRADELESVQNLLTNDRVDGITLNWSVGELTTDDTYDGKIRVDNVQLDIMTRSEQGEVWIYQVRGATQVFHFREETEQTPTGKNKWICTRWEDSPIGLARFGSRGLRPQTEEHSWGQIKHLYNPDASLYFDPSSGANVLANLERAYEKREFPEYDKLFSADFVFVFNPADVDDPFNPTPQQWARADEMDATQNLLTHDRVDGIRLNWSVGQPQPDDVHGWKVRVDNVMLDVTTRNEENEVWIFQVRGATHAYYFREESEQTLAGRNRWVCTRWEDSPIGFARPGTGELGPAVEETSWGQIKYNYH